MLDVTRWQERPKKFKRSKNAIRLLGLSMLCSDDERDICDSPNQQKSEREASIANRNNQIGEKPD